MPTYEFRCPQGHEFERFYRSISRAESHPACPVCGQPAERVLSPAGFAFKGSGFYLTDYGKNAHRKAPGDKAAAGKDAAPAAGDAAPAAKSDAPAAEAKKEAAKPAEPKPAAPAPKKKSAGE